MKKIISIILVIISLFTFTACANNDSGNNNSGNNQPDKVVDQVITSNYILYNGVTDYKIVISDEASDDENVARDELDSLFYEATGVNMPIISDEGLTHNAENKYICIGDNDLFRSANITIPEDAKGAHGYYIYTKDNTIYIIGQEKLGNRFGMYTFLFRILNFEQYSYDCYWIDKAVTEIPLYNYTIAHSPDYPQYQVFAAFLRSYNTARYRVYGPETYTSLYGEIDGQNGHNTLYLLKKDVYQAEHPTWFSYPDAQQLCFMAQGDEAERELMIEAAAENLIAAMKKMPDRYLWAVSNMDVNTVCGCEKCNELKEIFNGPNAQYIWFLNDLRDKVFEYFETEEGSELFDEFYQKNFKIESSFYWAYISVPSVKNEETGKYEPIENDDYPSVLMKENVAAHCAPISSLFQRSFYDEENKVYYEQLEAIAAISPEISLWMYSANFHYYMYPYDVFNSMQVNYQIWHNDFGVVAMLDETQNGNYLGMPGWHMLSSVLSSRLAHDIYLDQEAFIQRYFRGYFLDAAKPMMEYFDSMRNHTLLLLKENPKMGDCYYSIGKKEYWPKALIDEWQGYVAEAMEIIEKYKDTDKETYDMLYRHISLERVFLDYTYLYFYSANIGSRYSEIASRFAYDCSIHKITNTAEGKSIQPFLDTLIAAN